MDYNKHYSLLIAKATKENRTRETRVYYEQHHIQPKSEGGSNQQSNLVLLTAREHFLAHWLLYRAEPALPSRAHAFWRMCRGRGKTLPKDWVVISSRTYEEARLAHAKAISEGLRGQKKTPEHIAKVAAANRGKKRNQISKDKMSEAAKKRGLPAGFHLMKQAAALVNTKPVVKLDPTTLQVLQKFSSLKAAAQSVNLDSSNLSVAIKKRTRSGNFKWEFE
jgi:hypothetical protein